MNGAVCILPRPEGIGGPASFRARLIAGLNTRGVPVVQSPDDPECRALLVIGGTRRLPVLFRARKRGVRIVQRLNGMNWIHRRRFTGVTHFLRSEINNLILSTIRKQVADHIIYQSKFASTWWQTVYGKVRASAAVIYNGVDLSEYTPGEPGLRPSDRYRLLLVEGHLGGGNEMGLVNAVALARGLNQMADRPVELVVVGDVPASLQASFERENPGKIRWQGKVRREEVAALDRSAHALFSADVNAACPNSVIEALACGLPVVSYATGSLPELIEGDAGMVVPWGSNFWKLEPPDIPVLVSATWTIFKEQERFRPAARARAEAAFSVDAMVDRYLEIL
jgi:glycosyltransferase involved in cell wall biosynthesis